MPCQEYVNGGSFLGHTNYVAEIGVTLISGNGQTTVVMEVDSGAYISLLPLSFASLLNINLTSGAEIGLVGVGGATIHAYVHYLDIKMGTLTLSSIPVAIAEVDANIPALLGRLGVYDKIDVLMDNIVAIGREPSVCLGETMGEVIPPAYTVGAGFSIPLLVVVGLLLIGMTWVK